MLCCQQYDSDRLYNAAYYDCNSMNFDDFKVVEKLLALNSNFESLFKVIIS